MGEAEGCHAVFGAGHQALVPTPPSVAGEVSAQRTVNTTPLITSLKAAPCENRRTSNWLAEAPGTKSILTESGNCANADVPSTKAKAAPSTRHDQRLGLKFMDLGFGWKGFE